MLSHFPYSLKFIIMKEKKLLNMRKYFSMVLLLMVFMLYSINTNSTTKTIAPVSGAELFTLSSSYTPGESFGIALMMQAKPVVQATVTAYGYSQVMTSGAPPYHHSICSGQAVTCGVPALISPPETLYGPLMLHGVCTSTLPNIPSGVVDVPFAYALSAGPQTITPENHTGLLQTLTFTATPYYDANVNGILDAGDLAGDPATFVLTVGPVPVVAATLTALGYSQLVTTGDPQYNLTICSGQWLTGSNPVLLSAPAGVCGPLMLHGVCTSTLPNIPSGVVDVPFAYAQSAGPQTITPENHTGLLQTITFTATPYYDVNVNGIFDAGDVAGDPVTFVLTVCPVPVVAGTVSTFGYSQLITSGDPQYELTICSGQWLTGSNPVLLSAPAGACGPLMIHGVCVSSLPGIPTGVTDVPFAQAQLIGSQTIMLENHTGMAQTVSVTATPYYDVNVNGIPDAGDVMGDQAIFVLTVQSDLVLTCPDAIEEDNAPGVCGALVSFAATVEGTPEPDVTYMAEMNPVSSPYFFPVGSTTVYVTAANDCEIETCSFVVTVNDNEPPNAVCRNITVQLDSTGNASIAPADVDFDSWDNCGIESMTVFPNTFDCTNVGDNPVTLTITDIHNNESQCIAVVTVVDNIPPVFTAPADITIYTDSLCQYDISVGNTGDVTDEWDNCQIPQATYADMPVAGPCAGSYVILRTWSLVDVNGNQAVDQLQTITVLDHMAPVFTAPPDFTYTADDYDTYDVSVANTGDVTDEYDNCSPGIEAAYVDNIVSGSCYGATVIERTWHLEDYCGNAAPDQVQTITVAAGYVMLAKDLVQMKATTLTSGGAGVRKVGGKIEVKDHSSVTAPGTFAKSDIITVDGTSAVTNRIYDPATAALPAFELLQSTGTITVHVPDNAKVTLTGSSYKEVIVGKRATVTFTQTEIDIVRKVVFKEGSTIKFAPCTKVRIKEGLETEKKVKINPDNVPLWFYVQKDVHFRASNVVNGIVCLFNTKGTDLDFTLTVDDSRPNRDDAGLFAGMFFAKQIKSGKNNYWALNTNCGTCPGLKSLAGAEEPLSDVMVRNYPNPFSGATHIVFTLPEDSKVVLDVYDLSGKVITTLFDGEARKNQEYKSEFDGQSLSSGVYFYRMVTDDGVYTGKMILKR